MSRLLKETKKLQEQMKKLKKEDPELYKELTTEKLEPLDTDDLDLRYENGELTEDEYEAQVVYRNLKEKGTL